MVAESRGKWASKAAREGAAIRLFLGLMMCGPLFFARFKYTLSNREMSITLFVTVVSILTLAARGALRVKMTRVILFATAIAAMLVAATFGGSGRVSVNSFLLLVTLYLCFIFTLPPSEGTYFWAIKTFRRFATIVAIAGIGQFVGQLVIPGDTLFTFADFIPSQFLATQFNPVIPVPGLSDLNKSNGFFLLEPSSFSQLMVLSLIIELIFFPLTWRMAIFAVGLYLSFAGTGTALALVFVPLLLIRRGQISLLLVAACVVVVAVIFAKGLNVDAFTSRLSEFDTVRSSGFARFVAPAYLINDVVLPSARNTLFGLGPGAIDPFFTATDYAVHDPTWAKLFFEYGFIGFIPFAIFILYCFFAEARSRWLSAALFFQYLLLAGNLLEPRTQALILSLAVLHSAVPISRAANSVPAGRALAA